MVGGHRGSKVAMLAAGNGAAPIMGLAGRPDPAAVFKACQLVGLAEHGQQVHPRVCLEALAMVESRK